MLAFEVASRVSIRIRSTSCFLHSSTKFRNIMRLLSKSRLPDTSVRRNSLMGIILTSTAIVHPGAVYSSMTYHELVINIGTVSQATACGGRTETIFTALASLRPGSVSYSVAETVAAEVSPVNSGGLCAYGKRTSNASKVPHTCPPHNPRFADLLHSGSNSGSRR